MSDKPRILIIDDDVQNLTLLQEFLSGRFEVRTSSVPQDGLAMAVDLPPDLALIDVDMPGMSGFEVCEGIRSAHPSKPITVIFLTSDAQASSMQRALKAGANDYLLKPFRMMELMGRIEKRLGQAQMGVPLHSGNLSIDPAINSAFLRKGSKKLRIKLTHRGFQVLHVLMKNEGRILSRDQLLEQAWEGESETVSDRSVDLHVFRLRKLLSGWDRDIEAVYGKGYTLAKRKRG